jgi:beta-galactosidase
VHIFTSGDEAELFLNGRSLGKKKKGPFEYRLRWDDVRYEPGELKVVAYKNGKRWAEQIVRTTGKAARLAISADRTTIDADGNDLSFITVQVTDAEGLLVPEATHLVTFRMEGPGEIIATDNGDPASLVSFASLGKQAFSGKVLAIVRSIKGKRGVLSITATSPGLRSAALQVASR